MELNDRQIKFCEEYVSCAFNATEAAINAGYSKKTARSIASELLTKPNISAKISQLLDHKNKTIELTKERVLEEIAKIAFSDIKNAFNEDGTLKPIHMMDKGTSSIISSIEVEDHHIERYNGANGRKRLLASTTKKIRNWDKTKALEMLAKHYKIYSDAPKTTINFGKKKVKFS